MHLTIYVSTRHAIMLRASKCAPYTPPQKTKRNKCVWITVDAGDLTADEHDATRVDTFFHNVKSGNCYCLYKFHFCYPNCSLCKRKHLLLDGTKTYKETGQHNHSLETFACGLPQRYKDTS